MHIKHLNDIVSLTEAAGILGLTRTGVFRRIQRGALPAFKVGSQLVIKRSDLIGAPGRWERDYARNA